MASSRRSVGGFRLRLLLPRRLRSLCRGRRRGAGRGASESGPPG